MKNESIRIDDLKQSSISLGIGTTGNCNLNCPHCYSQLLRGNTLSFNKIEKLLTMARIDSINFGTGENILNPDFIKIVNHCHSKGIKLSLTSNGYSILCLKEEILSKFNDIDISLDFADKSHQNDFRKGESWDFVSKSIEKCTKLDIEFSITTALMNVNYREIPALLARVAAERCNLRINIFKKVPKAGVTRFALNYDEFWEAMGLLFANGNLISCSEPIVNAMLNIPSPVPKSPCGTKSIRVHPDGVIVPCVYWEDNSLKISDLNGSFASVMKSRPFHLIREIPAYCKSNCDKVDVCGGGCASRRYLNGDINTPDEYCPIVKNQPIPTIKVEFAQGVKDLVHSSYLCTMIFEGK